MGPSVHRIQYTEYQYSVLAGGPSATCSRGPPSGGFGASPAGEMSLNWVLKNIFLGNL